jgi:hypothetical protein
LIKYFNARRAYIPDYRQQRLQRHYIGSAHVEKGNDLLVARRQKHQGLTGVSKPATPSLPYKPCYSTAVGI